jgi:ABC-type multidrug transport system ATPase subunit
MEAAGQKDKEIKDNVPYLLDIVGLSNRMGAFPYQLSGGEKQRVAIARAMANNPKLLIADEPTGNLDPDTSWDIAQILYKINNWGTTVLMSTHGSDIVNSMHKRVVRLKSGLMVRDDFKGSYEDIDDYSMKIINSQEDEESQKIVTTSSNSRENEESENTKKGPSKSKKLTQISKKISFSTKNKKVKEDEKFEEGVTKDQETQLAAEDPVVADSPEANDSSPDDGGSVSDDVTKAEDTPVVDDSSVADNPAVVDDTPLVPEEDIELFPEEPETPVLKVKKLKLKKNN